MSDNEYIRALKLEVKAYDKVHEEIVKLAKKYEEKHNKKVKKKLDRMNELLGEYHSEAEAHEAYGYEYITWEEYEEICEALNSNEKKADVDDVEIVASRILFHLSRDTLKLYQTLKYESLSDEEKAEWDKQAAEWNARKEQRKKPKEGADNAE